MLRLSAVVERVRITGAKDLCRIPPATLCALDPWAVPEANLLYDRLCRSLGAHLGTTIAGREPRPGDDDPAVFRALLEAIRDAGCDLWAGTVGFSPSVEGPSTDRSGPVDLRLETRLKTRFFLMPADLPS